jgi:hypothetical protein
MTLRTCAVHMGHYRHRPVVVCELLTAHVRGDRFVEGHLASVFESGHITAILRRLKQIREEMT